MSSLAQSQAAVTGAHEAPASPRGLARLGIAREQLLFWLLLELWVLNTADLLLTRYALWLGFATESNGVMRLLPARRHADGDGLQDRHGERRVLVLWRVRRRPAALYAAVLLTGVFAAVVAYQAIWVASL